MRRLIGSKLNPGPQPTLDDTTTVLDKRGDVLSSKIDKIDMELKKLKSQIVEAKTPQLREGYKRRAAMLLRQKKMYMGQQNSLANQSFGLEQLKFTTEQMQSNMETVKAMKSAHKTLQKQYKKMNLDKIEQLQESMFDMMADAEELQDVLSRTYDVGEELDDADVMAELEGLEEYEAEGNYLDDLDSITVPKRKDPSISVKDNDFQELEEELQ